MRDRGPLSTLAAILLLAIGAGGQEPPEMPPFPVGSIGDPVHLRFEGVKTFSADAIRTALDRVPAVALASHPLARRDRWLPLLETCVRAGYLHLGFPQAEVEVIDRTEVWPIVVRVVEGPRFRCGETRVAGPAAEGVRESEVWRDEFSALWRAGEPAPFDVATRRALLDAARRTLARKGWFFPAVEVTPVLRPAEPVADLEVTIERLGPPGKIASIRVTGAERTTPEALVSWLGLASGQNLDEARLDEIWHRLHDSARFLDCDVEPEEAAPDSGGIVLHVSVTEYAEVPPLPADLPPEAAAMLRLREWLLGLKSGDPDIVFRSAPGFSPAVRFIAAPGRGFLFELFDGDTRTIPRAAIALTSSTTAAYSLRTGRRLTIPGAVLTLTPHVALASEPEDPERPFRLFIAAEPSATSDGERRPPWISLRLEPVAMVGLLLRQAGGAAAVRDGVLSMSGRAGSVRVAAATGQLLDGENQESSARVEPGAFDAAIRKLDAACGGGEMFDAGRPVGSVVRFAIADLAGPNSPITRLLGGSVLDPLEELRAPKTGEPFEVPPIPGPEQYDVVPAFAASALGVVRRLFAGGGWPSLLAAEGLLWNLGVSDPRLSQKVVERLWLDEDAGPLSSLAAALVFCRGDDTADAFVEHGRALLDGDLFRKDVVAILRGDSPFSRTLRNIAGALRSAPDEDISALRALLPPDARAALDGFVAVLRSVEGELSEDLLVAALLRAWQNGLDRVVSVALE
ncbi:MAG: hypothetical protein MUE73_03920 [Planctomycetes bacterium]|jgi:hypothetical protein|nr:hypothetical protein [Planctomycetota bacterium]